MVGVVVALDDGIYLVSQSIGARLRLRRLYDGRIRCIAGESLRFQIRDHFARVLAPTPGRFTEMTPEALRDLHARLPLKKGPSPCSFNLLLGP